MSSLQNLQTRSQELEEEIRELEVILAQAPEGRLICRANGPGKFSYYQKIRGADGRVSETYLTQNRRPDAVRLARKTYAQYRLPELRKEKRLIDKWIAHRTEELDSEKLLQQHPGITQLLTSDHPDSDAAGSTAFFPLFNHLPPDRQAMNWKRQPYNRNQKYPEQLKYPTVVPGLKVRSKSEADIIACFEKYRIPFHYDEIISINGTELAVDFVCINVPSRKLWYWDHRGMLDNPEYIQKTLFCDRVFLNAGIIPGINLIITTETRDCPLDLQWVDTLARYYLL